MAATLIVEDGSAKDEANSYVTLQEADDYWELRNDTTVWATKSDEAKIAALVQAAQYLDYNYRFIGTRYSGTQAMTWPRAVIGWDDDGRDMYADVIPQRIKDAQCELAHEAAQGALLPALDRGNRIQSQSVGPVSVTYFGDAPASKQYPVVDALLTDLLESGGNVGYGTVDSVLA